MLDYRHIIGGAILAQWRCEPCGHISDEKPGEICLVCGSKNTRVVKIVSSGGKIKYIGKAEGK